MKASTAITIALYITVLTAADSMAAESALPSAVRRDWLFQADERPDYRHALQQVERARKLAERLCVQFKSLDLATESADLARLTDAVLDSQTIDSADDDAVEHLYFAVRAVKRRIMLKHPSIDFSRILFIDQPYPRFPTEWAWPYDRNAGKICRHENSHRNGMMAAAGGKLQILDGLDGTANVRDIGPQASGSYWRPDLSFDGRRVLFCFKPKEDKTFHLYEVHVDGGPVKQLTFSEGMQTTRWSGPCVSVVQEDGVKRILGTVPVNADGSVYFPVPAGKMLFFQLLDERHRALQTMRSFTGAMPGETRGCVGCHKMHNRTPLARPLSALTRPPVKLTPPPWGDETIGYERFVQPVLDRYCVECHRGGVPESNPPDLRLRPGYSFMKEPYLTLVGPAIWIEPRIADLPSPDPRKPGVGLAGILRVEAFALEEIVEPFKWHNQPTGSGSPVIRTDALVGKYSTLRPMTALSYQSPLIQMAISGEHYDVQVDDVSMRKLIAWVDAMGPYRGLEEIRAIPDPDFDGIEELAIRPRTRTSPRIPANNTPLFPC